MHRNFVRAERASYLYAASLVTVLSLFVPFGGYERIMEGKAFAFALLAAAYLLSMAALLPRRAGGLTLPQGAALAYLGCSALSAVCSPYGSAVLLGGTRYDGFVFLALYVLTFLCLSRALRADARLVYCAAGAAALCCALALIQMAGGNPLHLYPVDLGYHDGDVLYAGFYAGTAGNVDFTAFLLALTAAACAAELVRRRVWLLAPVLALILYTLVRLGVTAAWLALACAAAWSPALLFPNRKRLCLALSAALTAGALAAVFLVPWQGGTLRELSRVLHGELDGAFGSGRLAIWRDVWALVRERPLLGGGPDTLYLRGVPPLSWWVDGAELFIDVTAAHNEYLNILVNQGVPALLAYLTLLGTALARCFRHAEEPRFVTAGMALLAYAAMAAVSISTPVTAPFVWLILAVAAGKE